MPDSSPIWVPLASGQEINVAPLLAVLATFDNPTTSQQPGAGASLAIRRTLRVLNTTEHDPALNSPALLVDVYQDLHRLQDMFEAITIQLVA